jgi:hypothetical protein
MTMQPNKLIRVILIILEAFLAVTAVAGGIGLISGSLNPGLALLKGSPFNDYTIPGLALAILVGGGATVATILMIRRHPWAVYSCALSGGVIMFFEIVEVLVVGSDPGIARNLQMFYFGYGLVLVLLAAGVWLSSRRELANA